MGKWVLLVFSVIVVGITIEAFRWHAKATDIPFSAISSLWKGDLTHLSLQERERVRERYGQSIFGVWRMPWIMAVVAAVLIFATVRAFFEQ